MTHPPVKCSLCCCFVVSLRQSSFLFYFLTLLPYPEPTAFLMKHGWKQNFASFLVPWPPGTFLLLLILPTKVLNPCAPILEWLLRHHLCWPYFSSLPRCWKRAFIVTDWSCRYTISNNTSSRWSSSRHCRIRRISACRSRLKIPLSNSHLTITQCSWRSCSWPHFDLWGFFFSPEKLPHCFPIAFQNGEHLAAGLWSKLHCVAWGWAHHRYRWDGKPWIREPRVKRESRGLGRPGRAGAAAGATRWREQRGITGDKWGRKHQPQPWVGTRLVFLTAAVPLE